MEDQITNMMDENNIGINWVFLILILIIVTHIVKIIKLIFCLVKDFDLFSSQPTSKKEIGNNQQKIYQFYPLQKKFMKD